MNSSINLQSMLRDIYGGFPILFTGSGFSAAAENASGEKLKTGGQFSKWLNDQLNYGKEYPLDIAAREYKDKFGEFSLFDSVTQLFTAETVTKTQQEVIGLPWRRIYTTNYDNVIEKSAQQCGKKVTSVNCVNSSASGVNRKAASILHLNGRLAETDFRDFDSKIRLTRPSYLTDSFLSSSWPALLRADLTVATAIVIYGYSTYDIDIARILYSDPQFRQKTYFIETVDLDPVFKRELEQFGIVIETTSDEVRHAIGAFVKPNENSRALTSFQKIEMPATAAEATGDDVQSLLLYGDFRPEIELGSRNSTRRYTVHRNYAEDILSRIAESVEKHFLIHSDLGNGKTIFVEQLMLSLASKRYNCFKLAQYDEYVEDDLIEIAKQSRAIIFIEDIFRNSKIVSKISTVAPDAVIIGTTRSAIYELRAHRVSEIFSGNYIEYDLNKLTEQGVTELTYLIDENGLWADFSRRTANEKSEFIKIRCKSEIRNVLIALFESPIIKDRIIAAFSAQPDSDSLKVLVSALLLDVGGFYPDITLVNQFSGVDIFKNREKINNTFSMEFIHNFRGNIKVKSSVFGEYVLQNVVGADYIVDRIIEILRICEVSKDSTSVFSDIQKEMIRFSFIDRVFKRRNAGDSYKRIYDSIKDLPSMARNPQFWLQYAIARLEDGNYRISDIHFRTAYSHASKIKGYDTFQIDNHYARYLLESRTNENTMKDDFKAFLDAHNLLLKQARKEKDAYYPYKVARRYHDFFRARGSGYTREQLQVLLNSCSEILDEISHISKAASKYYVIDECYRDLSQMSLELRQLLGVR